MTHRLAPKRQDKSGSGARIDERFFCFFCFLFFVFCNKRPGIWNIKRFMLIKEKQISQVKEFSTFPCIGRCKSLNSLKSFLWKTSQLSVASILCLFMLSFLRVHCLEWLQQLTARWTWQRAAYLSPSQIPLEVRVQLSVMWRFDSCNILSVLIWLAIF